MTDKDDDMFAGMIAAHLKKPVQVSADFDDRVMSSVREEARARAVHPGWWERPRVFVIRPVAALAAAAALVAAVSLGTLALSRWTVDGGRSAQLLSTVDGGRSAPVDGELVRFILIEPDADRVSLVGDFNGWDQNASALEPSGQGRWTATVRVPPGRHEYAFIVRTNGDQKWVADPYSATQRDEFGTETSLISVGRPSSGA